MLLSTAITTIIYDLSWAVYAETPFAPHSDARIGQCQFENGGVLDGKQYFADGVLCGDFAYEYAGGDNGEDFSIPTDEIAQAMIDELGLE
jgi:hypothetical protein